MLGKLLKGGGFVAALCFAPTLHAQQDAAPDGLCEPAYDAACIPGTQFCDPGCREAVGEGYSAQSCCGVAGTATCIQPPYTPPSCDNICGKGVCLASGFLSPTQQAFLPDCAGSPYSDGAVYKCVPDFLFGSFGNVVFKTCTSIAGAEGRCVPKCVTPVQDIIQYLPQDTCTSEEICAPCYDPRTGADTGACTAPIPGCDPSVNTCPTGCDTGPTQPPVVFQACCPVAAPDAGVDGGLLETGMCVPKTLIESVVPGASSLFLSSLCSTAGDVCIPKDITNLSQSIANFTCLAPAAVPDSGAGGDASTASDAGAGGASGAGGTASSSGGTSNPSAGTDAGVTAHSKDDGGCSCRMGDEQPSGRGTAALSLAALAGLFARGRRRRTAR